MPVARMALLALGLEQKADAMDEEMEKARSKHTNDDGWPKKKK
jgi:hypothetical protein